MAHTIKLDGLMAGFSVSACRSGEAEINTQGLLTTEDGGRFYSLLDEVSASVLSRIGTVRESQVDSLVVVFRGDNTAQVFVNETSLFAQVTTKCAVKAGQAVLADAIADTHAVVLKGVDVPEDAGVLVLLSARWRKGIFYDFGPLHDVAERRSQAALEGALASLWTYLFFQDRVGLTDDDWERLSESSWFPFVGLPVARVREMTGYARAGWSIDELVEKIVGDVNQNLARLREQIGRSALFQDHRSVVLKGLEHFEQHDYMSATLVLYPRIEGLLRSHHAAVSTSIHTSQNALAASAAHGGGAARHDYSLLLPARFEDYLRHVYFAKFDPSAPTGVNRNTVSHGVVREDQLNTKAATLAVLVVEQLAFLCRVNWNSL